MRLCGAGPRRRLVQQVAFRCWQCRSLFIGWIPCAAAGRPTFSYLCRVVSQLSTINLFARRRPMELRRIRKKSAEVEAADALRSHVVGGGVPPGGRLTEVRLSEALGLSRTTVRTALHQ